MTSNPLVCSALAILFILIPGYAYPVFDLGYSSGLGSMSSGMADSSLGYEKYADGFFLNPSMPARTGRSSISTGYSVYEVISARCSYLAGVYPLNANSVLSAGYVRFYYPGAAAINENIYMISPSYRISDAVSAGVNIKYYSTDSKLPFLSSGGLGLDFGITARLREPLDGTGFNLSLVLYDFHSTLAWESGLKDTVGRKAAAGIDYYAPKDILLSFSCLSFSGRNMTYIMTGAEKWFKGGLFAVRGGYKKKLEGSSRYHAGASAAGPGIRFDYSVSAAPGLGDLQHKIGLSLSLL